MAGLQYVDDPAYAGLILRRTYADLALPDAIMSRAHDWLGGTAARWDDRNKTYNFPSGATLSFGYLEHDNDMYRYQGAALHYLAWDELTQFNQRPYRYLFSRMRRPKNSSIPIRVRAGTNPGGVGHEWVRQRFLVEQSPDRVFVPAKLQDNPYLDADEYVQSLSELDPHDRQQLLEGDWFALPPGSKFQRQWFPITDEAPADARRVRFWDLAATEPKPGSDPDYTVGCLVAEKDGRYWVCDIRRTRQTPQGVEQLIRHTAEMDGPRVEIYMEQEPGSSGVNTIDHYSRRILAGFTFRGVRTTGSKEIRANPVSSAAEAGNVLLLRGDWLTALLDELSVFPAGAHDDQVDALSGAFGVLSRPRSPIVGPANIARASAWRI